MFRWLILSAVCIAGAVQAQDGAVQKTRPSPAGSNVAPSASVQIGTGITPIALREATRLRVHRLSDDQMPVFMEADRMDGDPNSDVTLSGTAQVRRNDAILKGDEINYRKAAGELRVRGNARILREATLVTGDDLRYNVDRSSGEISQPEFFLASGGYARASHADIFSRATMRLQDVTYSGCDCDTPAWYIKSPLVDLDFDENEGVARNGVLYFKDVPILASPYLTFPVKKERKSGFLVPTYGTTTRSGIEFNLPYYFNLSPSRDLTLTPRYFSKRGTQLGGEFRYLGESYSGTLTGTYLNRDQQTRDNRWLFSSRHFQTFGGGFYADWDVSRVSDNDYFRDFSSFGLNEATTVNLPQRGRFGWANKYWQAYGEVYTYQTLQDPDAQITPPYDKKPELGLVGQRYDFNGFDLRLEAEATRFSQPKLNGLRLPGQDGERLTAYPTIAYPIVRPGWFITPKIGVHQTQYQGTRWYGDPNSLGGTDRYRRSASRTQPIASIDSGMTFERDTTLFGKDSIQTLEPRLYYLNVPYRDQSRLPAYDTSLADFSFAQAFQENIYAGGWDRIVNANQLTAGLTSRWLDADSGFERMYGSIAQRFYFERQRVTLPNEVPRENIRSDFLASAGAALTDAFGVDIGGQYDPYNSRLSRALASVRWSPQRATTVSLAYRYQRDPSPNAFYAVPGQNQVSFAFQWPFTSRWSGVGRIDYSLNERRKNVVGATTDTSQSSRITQAIAGVEYKGDCCWIGRMVFQRYAVSAAQTNTALFFQLELSGLGALGTDPLRLLSRSVPGYQNIAPETQPASAFERYE